MEDEYTKIANDPAVRELRKNFASEGMWCGFFVFACAGIVLYFARTFLTRVLGFEIASFVVLIPGSLAICLMPKVRDVYTNVRCKLYCAKSGHLLHELDSLRGERVVSCARCYATLIGMPEQHRLEGIMKDPRLKVMAEKQKINKGK